MKSLVVLAALATLSCAGRAHAESIDCRDAHWSEGRPAINVRHIFCGEFRGRPDGYHSEAVFPTPLVVGVTGRREGPQGIYNATILFANGQRKFSTLYPRACTAEQIIRSIRFAVAQPVQPKPGTWGDLAPSAPAGATLADGYCLGNDGRPFTIRYALLRRGDVNTAFPDISEGGRR